MRYQGQGEESKRVRRKLKKLKHGVSGPVELPAATVREQMMEEVKNGLIDIGEPVCARQYKKKVVDKMGILTEKVCVIEGRKHPLFKLRKRLLYRNLQYMKLNKDEFFDNMSESDVISKCKSMGLDDIDIEPMCIADKILYVKNMQRTRHLKMWHDGAGIENHSHISFCVSVLYDPEVYYTDSEYFLKFGSNVCVQTEVEDPEVYIIGRCRNNDEQLDYIPTRLACLESLKIRAKS